MRKLIALLFLLASFGMQAQETIKVDGEKYMLHKVEKGHTLYAISKKYSVSVDDLIKENPMLKDGLKLDQTLRIPLKKMDQKEFKKSEVQIDGDTIKHKVAKKETLYGLSKKYNVPMQDIREANPIIEKEGLEIGMTVIVPVKTANETKPSEIAPALPDSFLLHEVKEKETLYSLSKQYGTSIDSLVLINDGLKGGLKVGSSIRVPQANPKYIAEIKEVIESDSNLLDSLYPLVDTHYIAVFLPFYTYINDTIETDTNNLKLLPYAKQSEIALEFWSGMQMALDSVRSTVTSPIYLKVFDTQNNTDTIKKHLQDPFLQKADLIVGPLYRSNFELVANWSVGKNASVVSPVPVSPKILLSKPNVFKVHSSAAAGVVTSMDYVSQHLQKNQKLVILKSGRSQDKSFFEMQQHLINEALIEKGFDSAQVVHWWTPNTFKARALFADTGDYVVLMPSENQAWVSAGLTSINDVFSRDTTKHVSIYGMEKWRKYDNIELKHWNDLNVSYPVVNNINYTDTLTQDFIIHYRAQYYSEPSSYAFTGFDLILGFVGALSKSASRPLEAFEYSGLQTRYNFIQVGTSSGFENQGSYLINLKDYQQKRIWDDGHKKY